VKANSRPASSLVTRFFSNNVFVRTAPIGKPEVNPMAKTNPEAPGCLNKGRINGSNNIPKKFTIPSSTKISEIIKKGNRAGINTVAQVVNPKVAPLKVDWG